MRMKLLQFELASVHTNTGHSQNILSILKNSKDFLIRVLLGTRCICSLVRYFLTNGIAEKERLASGQGQPGPARNG